MQTSCLHWINQCQPRWNAWWSLLSSWCACQCSLSCNLCQCSLWWTMSWCHGSHRCCIPFNCICCLNHFLHHVIMVNIRHNIDIYVDNSIPWFILDKLNISTGNPFPCHGIIQLVCFFVFRVANKIHFCPLFSSFFLSSYGTWAYATQLKET